MKSLNAPDLSHLESANHVVGQMRTRIQGARSSKIPYPWYEYESDVNRMLEAFLPHCVLSGVKLFTPSFIASENDYALEVDNMLHIRHQETDYLVLIESKHQAIPVLGSRWVGNYTDKSTGKEQEKDILEQLEKHIIAIHEYIRPVSKNIQLKILYYVVSNQQSRQMEKRAGHLNAELVLLGFDQLITELARRLDLDPKGSEIHGIPLRIAQSEFLDLLRLGYAHPHLGHPEISAAVRFVERCRRELDQGLFELLKPAEDCWLINGSAGMGKSVLLAYTAAVISCGHKLRKFQGDLYVESAHDIMERTKCTEARLVIAANSQKQLDSLQFWFNRFVEDFQEVARGKDLFFRRPKFLLFDDLGTLLIDGIPWSAVFLDEAHDLPDQAAHKLKQAHDKLGFYLVAACDRHQKIMDTGAATKVIPGFSFSGKYVRLKQIYRNPAAIYIASLALMFRWFASSGPKVLPNDSELRTSFGFDTFRPTSETIRLTLKTDAHPANSWSHSVARFNDAASVAHLLRRERLQRQEVLWVRFSKEERSFNYESLHNDFTYHNCRTDEAVDLNDKYVKGQEFPVVVIEGFPGLMDRYVDDENHRDTEKKMFKFRRELYLCASRATCFLFFICNDSSSDEFERIDEEIQSLLRSVSSPSHNSEDGNGVRTWAFQISTNNSTTLHPKQYGDLIRDEQKDDAKDTVTEIPGSINVSVEETEISSEPEQTKFAEPEIDPEVVANKYQQSIETVLPSMEANRKLRPSYPEWPIPDHQIPEYEFVIVVDQPRSVLDFARDLGVNVPDLLRALRMRGLHYATNSRIDLPVMRSLAFEFKCYPAKDEDEYATLSAEEYDADSEEDQDYHTPTALASPKGNKTSDNFLQPIIAESLNLPSDSPILVAKRDALDLLSGDSRLKVKNADTSSQSVFGTLTKSKDAMVNQTISSSPVEPPLESLSGERKEGREDEIKTIFIKPPIHVKELASLLGLKPFHIIADILQLGDIPSVSAPLHVSQARKICAKRGFILDTKKRK